MRGRCGLDPSSERIEPACPYFGHCGGCQYQHLSHAPQVGAKVEILRETLRRLGQVKWDDPSLRTRARLGIIATRHN